ncbi:MAG: ABC transporter ATP-binding protein [Armatimonadota bacterium]|nr:ABC transporter ATP-binding protein [Armatimonadota bacterium]
MGKVTVQALKPTWLKIQRGEFIVILGPSGSGKTTVLNLIGGIDRPTEGRVLFEGRDLSKMTEDEITEYRRKCVGFIFQFFNLIPTLTAKENVEFVAELVENPADVMEVLSEVGLADRADHFPSELSGGEQQRIAIARALVKNPPLLLADEPTGNLDYETGKHILALMRKINQSRGITIVIVTHNSAVAEIADRAIFLRSGEIVRVRENERPLDPEELKW